MATAKLPAGDGALLAWANHFSQRLNLSPGTYGISTLQAAEFESLRASFATARLACDPGIRCKSAVVAKNEARAAMKKSARLLASIIQGQANVTDAQKVDLGLTVRAAPTIAPRPDEAPAVNVVWTSGNTARVRVSDRLTVRRGTPPGVAGAAVFSFVGESAPPDLAEWNFEGMTRRSIVDVRFPSTCAPGTRVWFTAYWFNARKQSGPLAHPIGAYVPGGNVVMNLQMAA